MGLKEKISEDLKQSLKSGNQFRVGVLRMLSAAIHNKEIEVRAKNSNLTDEQIVQILGTEAKKRREAAELFNSGNRPDLGEKEKLELEIVLEYLPKQMNETDTRKAVTEIIVREKSASFAVAMKAVMKELKGKADAKLISEIIKDKFES